MKYIVPSLYIWRDSGLYLGSMSIPARDVKITSDQLVICLEGSIRAKLEDGSVYSSRSFLLKAGMVTRAETYDSSSAVLAVCYFSPTSQSYSILQTLMNGPYDGIYYDLKHEAQFVETLLKLRDEQYAAEEANNFLYQALIPKQLQNVVLREYDERIVEVIKDIQQTAQENVSIKALADKVSLSESRLVKLFKAQIGLPITRYRLRFRISLGAIHMAMGRSVTEAAMLSGFASTAHFSKCFVAVMGIQPSTAFLNPPFLNTIIADEILLALSKN